ncbi:MAG: sigma-70 family RNA polymerase sigma factor [Acidobacteriia bacterium]|nr:sigma-70 family RNA polymerase sigma factor [Terriglobia bacterium]
MPVVDWRVVVEQIQAGNPAGEEALYQNLEQGARFFLQRRLGTRDVGDIVHDVFLIVVDAIRRGAIREPERLMGFVRTILYRQLSSSISQIVRNRGTFESIESAAEVTAATPTPEQMAAEREQVELMKRSLRDMRQRDFEILTRFYLKNEPPERIQEELGITERQFNLFKTRAKARLTELLKKKLKPSN